MEALELDITEEAEHYVFSKTSQKVSVGENLKKHTNDTRAIWREIKANGWNFLGVVRQWSAVFEQKEHYLTVHHFVDSKPIDELIGKREPMSWKYLFHDDGVVGSILNELEEMGMDVFIPVQPFTDAYRHVMMFSDWDWHLESPKHKIQIWGLGEGLQVLIEVFLNMPLAPYGVSEPFEWPSLEPVAEYVQEALFDFGDYFEPILVNSPHGEEMGIDEEVNPFVLAIAKEAIRKIMTENDRVGLAFSGGKDSQTCLLLVMEYLLANPGCRTEFIIISSDTGVENPLVIEHLRRIKESIESLNLNIPFHIVQPDVENNYLTCVFGKGYAPPSSLFKWCVSRLKIEPSEKVLQEIVHTDLKTCLILGTRSSESATRRRSVAKHFGDDFYGTHRVEHLRTASPIRDWTATDVVTYLVRYPAPWKGYGNFELINLYGSAGAFGECAVGAAIGSENEAIKSCSGTGSRFGCWSCSVIGNDESLKNMTLDYPELEPYYYFRQVLKQTQDIRYGGMTGYQRRGYGKFGSGIGDLTIEIRTLMLQEMKRLSVPMKEEEVLTIYRFVLEREVKEGIPVTRRFREALFSHLSVHPGIVGAMFNPIWDPFNCGVDRFTKEDEEAIQRVLARKGLDIE